MLDTGHDVSVLDEDPLSHERLDSGMDTTWEDAGGRFTLGHGLEIDALREAGIEHVVIALPPGHEPPPDATGVQGGTTRSASVRAALRAARADAVVVHDAARPLVTPDVFTRVLDALAACDCAIAAAPVHDTIKEADAAGTVVATLDRSRLWAVQTPQAFRRAALERALDVPDEVLARATDDASLVERTGGSVRVVETSPANFKVTTPHDLHVAEILLRERC
jgi:2-C-methyl-D-erythritol 4-phosphate cytidylyltransferase